MTKEPHREKTKKLLRKALVLTSFSGQMGATIYLSVKLGQWLDAFFYNDQKLFVILGCLLGIAISFYFLLRQLKRFQQ